MVEEGGKKEEFDWSGEARGYISLDQARILAMRTSSETPGQYGRSFARIPMAFEVVGEDETEDHYVITLSFRPQGQFDGTPGQERFFIEKEGEVAHRQVLSLPIQAGSRGLPIIPIAAGLVVVAAIAVGVMFVLRISSSGDDQVGALASTGPTATTAPIAAVVAQLEAPASSPEPTPSAPPAPAAAQVPLVATPTPMIVEVIKQVPVVVTATPEPAPTATSLPAIAVAAPAIQARGTFNYYHPLRWGGDESLDPAVRQRWEPITQMVYDRLIRLNQSGQPRPLLAQSWEVNPDATSWTFIMRPNVWSSDGRPLTSKDVHYTLQHYLNPDVGSPLASQFNFIEPGRLELIDESTIRLNLTEQHADLPLALSNFAFRIIPEGSNPGEDGIGTGPFTVVDLDVDGVSTLVSHDNYWRGRLGVETVRLFAIAERSTQVAALRSGRIDMVRNLTPDQVQLFDGDPNFVVHENATGNMQSIAMRVTESPFNVPSTSPGYVRR